MTLIAYLSPKLKIVKDMVRQMFKYPHFRELFVSQDVKAYQTHEIWMAALLSFFLITLGGTDSENIFVSDILTLRTLC